MILYTSLNAVGKFDGEKIEKLDSGYINKYRDTLIRIRQNNEWKYSGQSAYFQGRGRRQDLGDEPVEFASAVNAACSDGDEGIIYTAIAGEVSGVIAKNYETGRENHIYHSNKYEFFSAQNCLDAGLIFLSAAEKAYSKSVAVYNRNTNDLRFLTSGEAIDDNPFYDAASGAVYYDSKGLGMSSRMEIVSVGAASIFKTNPEGTFCDEVLSERGYDLLCPKIDNAGNLYYIKRPYKTGAKKGGGNLFLDIILLPFRLVANIIKGLIYLSKIGAKKKGRKNVNTFGDNPSVQQELSDYDLFVYGEQLNAAKEEKVNSKKDKTAGFAPKSYELFRIKPGGDKQLVRRGVLSYDIDPSGALYYSNGRYVFKAGDADDKVVFKDKLIFNIKAY